MPTAELTLRDVAVDLRAWVDTLEGLEESSPEHEQALQAQAASILQSRDKVERFGIFLQRVEAEAEFLKSEAKRLTAKAKRLEALDERLRNYARAAMHENTLKRLDGHTVTLSVRSTPPAVEITDEAAVPSAYKILNIKMRADAWASLIIQAWPGAHDEARELLVQDLVISSECSIDRRAVKKAIDAGEAVEGCDLSIGGTSLQVK